MGNVATGCYTSGAYFPSGYGGGYDNGSQFNGYPYLINASNVGGTFPIVGVTALYLYTYVHSQAGGNSSSSNQGAVFQMQGIGYPTYPIGDLSIEDNSTIYRIGANPLSGPNISTQNNLRYSRNGSTYSVPLLSPLPVHTTSSTVVNLSSVVGVNTSAYGGYGTCYYGNISITVGTGLSISNGSTVYVSYNTSNYMWGTVTSYNSGNGALVLNVFYAVGGGTYGSWYVNITPVGSGPLRMSYNNSIYALPLSSLAQPVDAAGYSGFNQGLPTGWSSGGGTVTIGLTSTFAIPYTLVGVTQSFFLFAYGYGDNQRWAQCQFNLYYSTTPGGGNWIGLYSGSASIIQGYCWVAAELFGGWYAPKTILARYYIGNIAPKWFKELYIKHGEKIAKFIKNKPILKSILRPLFELFALTASNHQRLAYGEIK